MFDLKLFLINAKNSQRTLKNEKYATDKYFNSIFIGQLVNGVDLAQIFRQSVPKLFN